MTGLEMMRCLLRVFLLFRWDKRQTFIYCLWLCVCPIVIPDTGCHYWTELQYRISLSTEVTFRSDPMAIQNTSGLNAWLAVRRDLYIQYLYAAIYIVCIGLSKYVFNWFNEDDAFDIVMLNKCINANKVFLKMMVSYRQIFKVKYLYRKSKRDLPSIDL